MGWEAACMCAKPGDAEAEALLRKYVLGPLELPYRCKEALVYRLAAPAADHYFFINDGPAVTAFLSTGPFTYTGATDAVTGEAVDVAAGVALEPYSGRWLRLEK
jgi:beta-galactosidase